jgi:hypothetical protein
VIDFITMDKAHLNYGCGVEVYGLAALRHGVERNGIAGAMFRSCEKAKTVAR